MYANNIGEGIAFAGIMIACAITENYWLLLALILPVLAWRIPDEKVRGNYNKFVFKRMELEIEELQEKIRLLKTKKG